MKALMYKIMYKINSWFLLLNSDYVFGLLLIAVIIAMIIDTLILG